jgi:hypothetical protein
MFRSILILLWLAAAPVFASETQVPELDGSLALKIINMQAKSAPAEARITAPDVRIAMIQSGTSHEDQFELAHVRRVTSVESVIEDGAKVRRMACREFHWTPEYGWFTWEGRKERGGESVWIWSELKGEVVIR